MFIEFSEIYYNVALCLILIFLISLFGVIIVHYIKFTMRKKKTIMEQVEKILDDETSWQHHRGDKAED